MASMHDAVQTGKPPWRVTTELDARAHIDRANELYKAKLIAKQDFDQKQADYDTASPPWEKR